MPLPSIIERRLHAACSEAGFGLSFQFPGGVVRHFGRGDPVATVVAKDGRGAAALRSMDVVRIGEAYLSDSIDIVGDICRALSLRAHGGVGVTLSERQHELATRRIHAAGLADRVEVRVQDYRDLDEPSFDKVAGIGIFEHVGRAGLAEYFGQAYRMLEPGGLFINHGIAVRMPPPDATGVGQPVRPALRNAVLGSTGFRRKYLWPNGDLVPLSVATTVAEQTGFQVCDVENLRPHYVLTLVHWRRNMDAAREEALRIGGEAMYRLWRLFLAFAEHQFRSGAQTVNQVLMLKQAPDGEHPLPLTRDDLARDA